MHPHPRRTPQAAQAPQVSVDEALDALSERGRDNPVVALQAAMHLVRAAFAGDYRAMASIMRGTKSSLNPFAARYA